LHPRMEEQAKLLSPAQDTPACYLTENHGEDDEEDV